MTIFNVEEANRMKMDIPTASAWFLNNVLNMKAIVVMTRNPGIQYTIMSTKYSPTTTGLNSPKDAGSMILSEYEPLPKNMIPIR